MQRRDFHDNNSAFHWILFEWLSPEPSKTFLEKLEFCKDERKTAKTWGLNILFLKKSSLQYWFLALVLTRDRYLRNQRKREPLFCYIRLDITYWIPNSLESVHSTVRHFLLKAAKWLILFPVPCCFIWILLKHESTWSLYWTL